MTYPYEPSAPAGGSSVSADHPAGVPVVGLAHGSRHPRGAERDRGADDRGRGARPACPRTRPTSTWPSPTSAPSWPRLAAEGHRRAVVVPLLFTVAFHATVDVPDAVTEAARTHGVELVVSDILGTGDDIAAVLRGALDGAGVSGDDDAVLFAVGSSRPEANEAVADLAARLSDARRGAVARRLRHLRAQGRRRPRRARPARRALAALPGRRAAARPPAPARRRARLDPRRAARAPRPRPWCWRATPRPGTVSPAP